jgi:hypothetical protein
VQFSLFKLQFSFQPGLFQQQFVPILLYLPLQVALFLLFQLILITFTFRPKGWLILFVFSPWLLFFLLLRSFIMLHMRLFASQEHQLVISTTQLCIFGQVHVWLQQQHGLWILVLSNGPRQPP